MQIAQHCIPGPPKVCKIMAFMAVIIGLGLLFYILSGSRYSLFVNFGGRFFSFQGVQAHAMQFQRF